jgi:hypothetical protein
MTPCAPSHLRATLVAVAAALLLPGCAGRGRRPASPTDIEAIIPSGTVSLNRGDWVVGQTKGVWKVEAQPATSNAAPERLGYVTARLYREVRGGPTFTMYEVSTLDRAEIVGTVDSLGNAQRFRPRRDGGIDTEKMGNNTLALSVQAIFGTMRPVTLVATTERALAFEALDLDKDGLLDATEFPRVADRMISPDRNRDGKVDPQEFDAADDL